MLFSFMRTRQSGQSLLEAILAIALFAISLGALVPYLNNQLSQLGGARASLQAQELAEEGLEALRSLRDQNWSLLTPGSHGIVLSSNLWALQSASDTANGFTRSVTLTDLNANEKYVLATVTWLDSFQRARMLTLPSVITNFRYVAEVLLSGNWYNPQTLGTVDLGPGNSATGLAVRSGMVYMTATASDKKKPDFYVIDATNGAQPIVRGSVNVGEGLHAVALSGNYAYVASQDQDNQLQVIDVTTSTSPLLVTAVPVPADQEGLSIAVTSTTLYLGLKGGTGPDFFVIDISNPVSPVIRGSLTVGADINAISVFKNRVVLATSKDTAEFVVVNATDPTTPSISNSFDVDGTQDAMSLYTNSQDSRAYLVRVQGDGLPTHPQLVIFDATNPDSAIVIGTLAVSTDVNAVFAADNLAFLATSDANQEFKIMEVSNPSSPQPYSGLNFPQVASGLAFENNTVYVSVRSNDALRIITSQ